MMLPDALIIREKTEKQRVFSDEKSKEEFTGIVKRKYKLSAGEIFPDVFIYFLTFSKNYALKKNLTIDISLCHWEDKDDKYLKCDKSYIEITKYETLGRNDLLFKTRDTTNQFLCVARLCDEKFNELLKLVENNNVRDMDLRKKISYLDGLLDKDIEDFTEETIIEEAKKIKNEFDI